MVLQCDTSYIAEKRGNVELLVDAFVGQQRYCEAYCSAVPIFSADDEYEGLHWFIHATWAAEELYGLYPFRSKLLRRCKLAGLEDVDELNDRFSRWPLFEALWHGGISTSADGLVGVEDSLLVCMLIMLFAARTGVHAAQARVRHSLLGDEGADGASDD